MRRARRPGSDYRASGPLEVRRFTFRKLSSGLYGWPCATKLDRTRRQVDYSLPLSTNDALRLRRTSRLDPCRTLPLGSVLPFRPLALSGRCHSATLAGRAWKDNTQRWRAASHADTERRRRGDRRRPVAPTMRSTWTQHPVTVRGHGGPPNYRHGPERIIPCNRGIWVVSASALHGREHRVRRRRGGSGQEWVLDSAARLWKRPDDFGMLLPRRRGRDRWVGMTTPLSLLSISTFTTTASGRPLAQTFNSDRRKALVFGWGVQVSTRHRAVGWSGTT